MGPVQMERIISTRPCVVEIDRRGYSWNHHFTLVRICPAVFLKDMILP